MDTRPLFLLGRKRAPRAYKGQRPYGTYGRRPYGANSYKFRWAIYGGMVLIVLDPHSKWPDVITVPSTTSEHSIKKMLFSRYGLIEQIISDNGPQFCSEEFSCFMEENGINIPFVHHITPPQMDLQKDLFKPSS